MEERKKLNTDFQSNLDYVLINLEKDIYKANSLDDKQYLEISKNEIIEFLNYVYQNIKS